ncbi:hypothetical protein [Methanolobus sp.]|uniref:hypothetical protein n=1 Tax=Methanolobus sp. TaxID=1874737 RepID=UPI0025D2856B|nr:hypothetical protein [Methanolobus sp.]
MSRVQQYIDKKLANYIMKKLPSNRPGIGHHESYARGNIAPSLGLAYYLEQEVSVFSDSVLKLKQEMFRNRFYWKPCFVKKCKDCGAEYDENIEKCTCGSASFHEPDYSQVRKKEYFIEKANYNGQSLKEVLSDFEFNLNVADNAYLLLVKAYDYDRAGDIALEDVKEILSIDPRDIKKMVKKDGRMGGDIWLCPTHRDKMKHEPGLKCPVCGALLQQAYYETTSAENKQYYLKDEILHSSKYYPSILYGYPPALKMIDDIMAYHYLEKRTKTFYERGRAPGIATFPTNNPDSLRKFWDETMVKLQDDPYYIPLIGYNTDSKGQATMLQLMQDPNLDMLEVKKELRERISSRFGVSLIFQGDTSTSGGLNNEGLQMTVTNRAVEDGQTIYNEKVLEWLCTQFGITDYVLQLNPNEEQDEMAEKERLAKDISNARGMYDMGFDVEYVDGEFVFSGEATSPEERHSSSGGFFPTIEDPQRNTGEPATKSFDIDTGDYLVKDFASDALKAIAEGALYQFYEDATEKDVEAIHGIIKTAFETGELGLDKIRDAIVQATSFDSARAEMIARTETSAVAMRAREIGWKKMEEERGEVFLFRTSEANDHRMSEVSKRIAARVTSEGGAVPLERLKEIYMEESTRPVSQGGMGPSWTGWKNFVAHPNERSTIVRVV